MAIRPIVKMGDPRLLQVSEKVTEFDTPELHALIQDLQDTMTALNGAGIAAPQIGVNLQVVIFGVGKNPRYPDAEEVPFTVLINPELAAVTEEMEEAWEGCLSVPGMRGVVPRYKAIRYTGYDQYGNRIERDAVDFHARVVQHETDHLFGILYPFRITGSFNAMQLCQIGQIGGRESTRKSMLGRMPSDVGYAGRCALLQVA